MWGNKYQSLKILFSPFITFFFFAIWLWSLSFLLLLHVPRECDVQKLPSRNGEKKNPKILRENYLRVSD